MSDLTAVEKMKLEKALKMADGFVMNFTNRSFAEFILGSTELDIYNPKYDYASGSKANRLRAFWKLESNYAVGNLLEDIFRAWPELGGIDFPLEECIRIARRLKESAPVPDIEVVLTISVEKEFETLAKSIRDSISRNEPESGLDRLHTFLVKYFRTLCGKYGISHDRDKPLHSLVGEYVKVLRSKGLIESEMTERILKSSISIMEAFNTVRNEQSYAHDNPVLSYDESLLVLSHVTSSIRFIQAIESR